MNSNQRKKIEDILKWSVFDEYEGHIANIRTLRGVSGLLGQYCPMDVEKYINYMDASSASKAFFSAEPKELVEKYFEEIESVSSYLGDESYSQKQKILNFMEYIRISGMYENLSSGSVQNQQVYPSISQSGLSIAILGKGVCTSQAEFLSHLLIASDMEAYHYQVQFHDKETGKYIDSHEVVTAEVLDTGNFFLDPTFYNGSLESLRGSFDMADFTEERRNTLSILDVTEQEIEEARETAQNYLIKRYGIKEISQQLGLESCGDLEKQMRILTFMEKNLAPTNQELAIRSVVMGSHELEVGKLLELFYKANGIPYKMQFDEGKQNTIYTTMIDGVECSIFPRNAFSKTKSDLSTKLHFTKDDDGNLKYLWAFSNEKKAEMAAMIRKGREIAEEVKIPQETLDVPEFEWGDDEDERIKNAQKTPEEIQAEETEILEQWWGDAKEIKIFKTQSPVEEYYEKTGIMQDSEHDKTKKTNALMELYQDESIDANGVNAKNNEIRKELKREEITQNQEK